MNNENAYGFTPRERAILACRRELKRRAVSRINWREYLLVARDAVAMLAAVFLMSVCILAIAL